MQKHDPYVKFCLRHCGVAPYNKKPDQINNWGMAVKVAWLWSVEAVQFFQVTNPNSVLVWTMMEFFVPQVQDATRYLPTQEARNKIVAAVYRNISLGGLISGYDDNIYNQDKAALNKDFDFQYPQNGTGLPASVNTSLDAVPNQNAEAAIAILWICAQHRPELFKRPEQVLVTCLCAVAKQGHANPRLVSKIINEYHQDTGRGLDLDTVAIKACWDLLVHHVDDGNVGKIISDWCRFLPPEALRFRIMLEQIPDQGLTCIVAIIKAMTDFPTFDWAWVHVNFPSEFEKVYLAITAITGKPYYGYKKDLSLVKSTNFRTIGYIAQQLLMKAGGEKSLGAAACFTRTPMLKLKLDQMVNTFVGYPATLTPPQGAQMPQWMNATLTAYTTAQTRDQDKGPLQVASATRQGNPPLPPSPPGKLPAYAPPPPPPLGPGSNAPAAGPPKVPRQRILEILQQGGGGASGGSVGAAGSSAPPPKPSSGSAQ